MTRALNFGILLLVSLSLPACELVGDIFQAGLMVGIIIIVAIVLLIGWVMKKFKGPRV